MEDQNMSKGELERLERSTGARNRKIKKLIVWLIVLIVIGGGIYGLAAWQKSLDGQKPGEAIPELGREHIPDGDTYGEYNSNPPTSGPHYGQPANWGFYEGQIPDERLVHNLEHGGVWISYRDIENDELKTKLRDLAAQYSLKVIITHRPENDFLIAAAAWGKLLKLDEFDEAQINDFIRAYINKGPEQTTF